MKKLVALLLIFIMCLSLTACGSMADGKGVVKGSNISASGQTDRDVYIDLWGIYAEGSDCARYTFDYPSKAGLGHFIHTYVTDGNPIPTFQGEPERVEIPNDIDAFTNDIWENLDENNKISLYVRYVDLASGQSEERLINKNTIGG